MNVKTRRQVRLVRQRQQVEHQRHVLLVRLGHADRRVRHVGRLPAPAARRAGSAARSRARSSRYSPSRARSGAPSPVSSWRRSSATKSRRLRSMRRCAGAVGGGAAAAEHALEDDARVDLHRQRRRGRLPVERVDVGAAVSRVARADETREVLGGQLQRRERSCPDRSRGRSPGRATRRCGSPVRRCAWPPRR